MPQPLPLFPNLLDPNLEKIFVPFCEDVSPDGVAELLSQITAHVQDVREAMRRNEFIDITLAENIAQTLSQLLRELATYPENKRRLIVGAARYFMRSQDAQADLESILGFDDDAAVLNYVLKEIGRSDMKVDL